MHRPAPQAPGDVLCKPADASNRSRNLTTTAAVLIAALACSVALVWLAWRLGIQGQVVAVGVQAAMLDRARGKARDAGLTNVQFVCAAAGDGALGSTGRSW